MLLSRVLCSAQEKNAQYFSFSPPKSQAKDEQQDCKKTVADNSESKDSPVMKSEIKKLSELGCLEGRP